MRLLALLALVLVAAPVAAEDWFTISGYPEIPDSDVVQISPAISSWQRQVTLEVRATRKQQRMGYGGTPYRSYTGVALVDCDSRKGGFLTLTYFGQPNWQGEPAKVASFKPEDAPMAFADIPGNPSAKLINAACAAMR